MLLMTLPTISLEFQQTLFDIDWRLASHGKGRACYTTLHLAHNTPGTQLWMLLPTVTVSEAPVTHSRNDTIGDDTGYSLPVGRSNKQMSNFGS